VLEYGGSFRTIPLSIQRSLFGYMISGFDDLKENISESLRSLLAKSVQVGYITGHSETELADENGTNLHFTSLLSTMYEFRKINLAEEDVPAGISTIIINGPKTAFSESELYKVDQFVMRGGNLMIFADPFDERQGGSYQQADYVPVDTGLDTILNAYGITLEKNYVFDEECYIARQGYSSIPLYWAPMMQKRQLSQKNPISKNLGYVIFLNAGAIDVSAAEQDAALSVTALAKSSAKSWTESRNIQLNPMAVQPPYDKSVEKAENLAVLVEGTFKSAFDGNPADGGAEDGDSEFSTSSHIPSGIQRGRIFVAGTSYITGNQLVDEDGSEPVALFVRNAVDYMNGNADLCEMRTKGLSLNTLSNTGGSLALVVKYFNQFGLAVLVALAGLLVWRLRVVRRNKIRCTYNPSDSREIKA
ncbi:MAG: Gldg family protein, partial [Treponemataceae bacterium]|nr:Gldg family protein [Treponemataceae bacterium]